MINKYPYTDFNEYNMDWIIKTVKDLSVQWAETHQEWQDVQTEWTNYKNYIDTYFDNLDLSQEVSDKIDQMAADGYFSDLFISLFRGDVIAAAGDVASTWIADNLMQEVGYVIDASLTVENAAADAKAAGDAIREVNKEDNGLYLKYIDAIPYNLVDKEKLIVGYYINANGVPTASATWNCTDFIDISQFTKLSAKNIGLGAYYDNTKTFLSSVTLGNSQNVTIPAGAKWLRVSILPANVDTATISYIEVITNGVTRELLPYWKSPFITPYDGRMYATTHTIFTVPVNNQEATSGTASNVNYEGTPNYVNVDCALTLPWDYTPAGVPCKLVMFCHGAGRGVTGADNWFTIDNYRNLVETFTSRGYAVFDCNGFNNTQLGQSFWGKEMGVEAWRKAYRYIITHYNVQKDFSIYAFSMGGLTALNMIFQAFPNINAVALGSPVIDLEQVFNSTDGTKAVLQTLYGLGDTWDDSKVIGQNPWKHITTENGVKYCNYKLPPIKIWYGELETGSGGNPGVNKAIAQDFVTAVCNSGGYAFYREVAGSSHSICYGSNAYVNAEILTFIERFEKVFPNSYD